jgi:UDPglucose 6-dehydrogenase
LIQLGARVKAYDPIAMPACKAQNPDLKIQYCESASDAVLDADAAVLVTEWDEFRSLDLERMALLMHQPILVDGRNLYDPEIAKNAGFDYTGIGRASRPRSTRAASKGTSRPVNPSAPADPVAALVDVTPK